MHSLLKKALLFLQEKIPGQRIFFIYTHKNGHDRFANGLKANTEISFFSYSALKKAFPLVSFLKIENEDPAKIRQIKPEDVVIGHIGETYLQAAKRTKKVIAFYPWSGHLDRSTNTLFNCLPKEEEFHYLSHARSLILLTSEYNKRCYIECESNFWHPFFKQWQQDGKRLRIVHQPIDLQLFPRIKSEYATSDFLYIGNDAHMKGLPESKLLVEKTSRQLHIYGVGDTKLDNLNRRQVEQLPAKADFFIQHGMWEAQCVSLLEAAARGFIPVVTQETGYPYEHPYLLKYGDGEYNFKILKELLSLPHKERKALGDHLHTCLINDPHHNNWNALGAILMEEAAMLNGKNA